MRSGLREQVARWCGAAGIGAVVVVALVNLMHATGRTPVPPLVASAGEPDALMRQERRLAALRRSVESRGLRGVVGYVGDLPGTRVLDEPQTVTDYFQTQFVLVPLVLDLNTEHCEWAVANLRRGPAAERLPPGFGVVEDFGGGVLLLRKAVP